MTGPEATADSYLAPSVSNFLFGLKQAASDLPQKPGLERSFYLGVQSFAKPVIE